MNRFRKHIPFQQLADYADGRLSSSDRLQVEAHIAICVTCAAKVTQLQQLISRMRTDTSEDAPSNLITRVKGLFRSRPALSSVSADIRHRFLAVLRFDSWQMTPALGVRSGKSGSRQLLFSTGVDEIDLRIEPVGDVWAVSGQILGESATGGKAILQGAAGTRQSQLNDLNEFILPTVEAGTYKLILNLEDTDVEIEELKIGK